MDTWRVEPFRDRPSDRSTGLPAGTAWFRVAGLSRNLVSLQQELERDFPLTLALDLTDRQSADALAPDLTADVLAMLRDGAADAARHEGITLVRLGVHVGGGSVILRIEGDGIGFPFKGTYNLAELMTFGVGPRKLIAQVAARGGQMRLDCGVHGTRIDITLSRFGHGEPALEAVPAIAAE